MIGGFYVNDDSGPDSEEEDYGEEIDESTRNDDMIFSSKSSANLSNRQDAGLNLNNSAKSQLHNSVQKTDAQHDSIKKDKNDRATVD